MFINDYKEGNLRRRGATLGVASRILGSFECVKYRIIESFVRHARLPTAVYLTRDNAQDFIFAYVVLCCLDYQFASAWFCVTRCYWRDNFGFKYHRCKRVFFGVIDG